MTTETLKALEDCEALYPYRELRDDDLSKIKSICATVRAMDAEIERLKSDKLMMEGQLKHWREGNFIRRDAPELVALVEACLGAVKVCNDFLPPDGISADNAISDIIYLFDNPIINHAMSAFKKGAAK